MEFGEREHWNNEQRIKDFIVGHKETEDLICASTRLLHSRVYNLVSLRELCMRSVVLNMLPRFSEIPQWIDRLPLRLKSDILTYVLDIKGPYREPYCWHQERRYLVPSEDNNIVQWVKKDRKPEWPKVTIPLSVFRQLINSTLQRFDFDLCVAKEMFFDLNGLDFKILQFLAKYPEGMRSIVDRRSVTYLAPEPSGSRNIIDLLIQFTNLEHLNLNTVRFSDDDVESLSKSCHQLKSITLIYSATLTIKGLQILGTLPQLEELTLCEKLSRGAHYQEALKIIPQLKRINRLDMNDSLGMENFDSCIYLNIRQAREHTFRLERLSTFIRGSEDDISKCLSNLREVVVCEPLNDDDNDRRNYFPGAKLLRTLPFLTSLTIIDAYHGASSYNNIGTYLEVLGPKLTHVCVIGSGYCVDVFRILLLCPNLTSLRIEDYLAKRYQSEVIIDPQQLKLRQLHLKSTSLDPNYANFSRLLLAPELHTVRLENIFISPDDILNGSKPFLLNLVHFHSSLLVESNKTYDLHVKFLKLIVEHCTRLQTFESRVIPYYHVHLLISLADISQARCHFSVKDSN